MTAGTLVHDGDPETARQMSRVTARAVPKGWALASASGESIVAPVAAMLAVQRALTAPRLPDRTDDRPRRGNRALGVLEDDASLAVPRLAARGPSRPRAPTAPAPLPDPAEPLSWVRTLLAGLERRRSETAVFDDYYEGIQPLNFDEEFRAAFGPALGPLRQQLLGTRRRPARRPTRGAGLPLRRRLGRCGPVGHLAGQRPRWRECDGAHRGAHQARRLCPRRAPRRRPPGASPSRTPSTPSPPPTRATAAVGSPG